MKTRRDASFPSHSTFSRFGSKKQFVTKVLSYCKDEVDYEDVVTLCVPIMARLATDQPSEDFVDELVTDTASITKDGYVYMCLLKIGREKRYKIGKAILVGRRTDQVSIQLPEDLELVHVITTDDAFGIENYWHKRFAAKNTKGEWFSLSRQDIDAFKRRKFM